MRDEPEDIYGRQWSARKYLRQFYAGPEVSADELANARFLARELRVLDRRFRTALEFGCGPTVHHAASLAPWVDSLDMADYLEANLDELRRWLGAEQGAHDWSVYLSGVLRSEGMTPDGLATRQALLRKRVSRLLRSDLRAGTPLGEPAEYELVASYYCIEAVATSRAEWAAFLSRVAGLVAPGGVLLLGAMRRCHQYKVAGTAFQTAYVSEADFAMELPKLGFPLSEAVIEVVDGSGWGEQGFDSICCVRAVKSGQSLQPTTPVPTLLGDG